MSRDFDVVNVPQRSPEWFAARLGRLTGSVAGDMLARTKTGPSASRANLLTRLVLERLTGKGQERDIQTDAMQDGIDREADARRAYEAHTGALVSECGFLAHRTLMAGASLDGYLGDFDGLLSMKCRQPKAHLATLRSGTIPADALAQMRHECWLTGAREHHYWSWNPDFPPALQGHLIVRTRDALDIDAYDREASAFLAEVDAETAAVATMAYLHTRAQFLACLGPDGRVTAPVTLAQGCRMQEPGR